MIAYFSAEPIYKEIVDSAQNMKKKKEKNESTAVQR